MLSYKNKLKIIFDVLGNVGCIYNCNEKRKLDTATCWPLNHIWYPVVFYLLYPVFKKVLITYQHLEIGSIPIKIQLL